MMKFNDNMEIQNDNMEMHWHNIVRHVLPSSDTYEYMNILWKIYILNHYFLDFVDGSSFLM